MHLLRLAASSLALSLLAALPAPAGADQVFSTVSTGPIHGHATPQPYPLGDIYYAPCDWYGNGNYGGSRNSGHGGHNGSTTLTGERFYPYDIRSDGNRTGSHGGRRGNGYGNCYGNRSASPSPYQPIPAPRASPRSSMPLMRELR